MCEIAKMKKNNRRTVTAVIMLMEGKQKQFHSVIELL